MNREPDCYAARLINMGEVKKSRSGGFFISLCHYVFKHSGVVYGCSGENPHHIIHKRATNILECESLRNPKYVQSDLLNTFSECANDLESGMIVLFSGTGCQIHGLLRYLEIKGVEDSGLVTVDLVCHGVPSPGIWETYLNQLETNYHKRIVAVNFRDKEACGWEAHKERIDFDDNSTVLEDVWTNLFYSNTILRGSCLCCPYTSTERNSDFTIGDYWGIGNNVKEFDDNKGVNLVLVHSDKGKRIFNELHDLNYRRTDLKNSLQPNLYEPSRVEKKKREKVLSDYKNYAPDVFINKYLNKNRYYYLSSKLRNKCKALFG